MTRRKFSREFKIEAVRLVTDRGVAVAQAARDLDVAESVLRRWMRTLWARWMQPTIWQTCQLTRSRNTC